MDITPTSKFNQLSNARPRRDTRKPITVELPPLVCFSAPAARLLGEILRSASTEEGAPNGIEREVA
jgi:hypothetical protein